MRTELKQEISLIKARVITKGTKVAEFISRHQREYKLITGALIGGIMVDSILEPDIVLAAPRVNLDVNPQEAKQLDFPFGWCTAGGIIVLAGLTQLIKNSIKKDPRWEKSVKPEQNPLKPNPSRGHIGSDIHVAGFRQQEVQSDQPEVRKIPHWDDSILPLLPQGVIALGNIAIFTGWRDQETVLLDRLLTRKVPNYNRLTPKEKTKTLNRLIDQRVEDYNTLIRYRDAIGRYEKAIDKYKNECKLIKTRYISKQFDPPPYEPINKDYLNKFERLKERLINDDLDQATRDNLYDELADLSRLLVRVSNSPKYFL